MNPSALRAALIALLLCFGAAAAAPTAGNEPGGQTASGQKVAGKTKYHKTTVKPKRTRATVKKFTPSSSKKTLAAAQRERARLEREANASAAEPARGTGKP